VRKRHCKSPEKHDPQIPNCVLQLQKNWENIHTPSVYSGTVKTLLGQHSETTFTTFGSPKFATVLAETTRTLLSDATKYKYLWLKQVSHFFLKETIKK